LGNLTALLLLLSYIAKANKQNEYTCNL